MIAWQCLSPSSRINSPIDPDITDVVRVEEAQGHLGETLCRGVEIRPGPVPSAGKPPGCAGRHEGVVQTIAVEIAAADLRAGFDVNHIVNHIARFRIRPDFHGRHHGILPAVMGKHVGADVHQILGYATQLDRVPSGIQERVMVDVHGMPSVTAVRMPGKARLRPVHIELMRVMSIGEVASWEDAE